MHRRRSPLVRTAVLAVVFSGLACVGPVIILPPPDAPEGVDTEALAGYATYCGQVHRGEGNDGDAAYAFVFIVNDGTSGPVDRAPDVAVVRANVCGCYEDLTVRAEPGDQLKLYYWRDDGSPSESKLFTADLSDELIKAPTSCIPCSERCP
ncbi:MAG TPA: hypothetical protein VG389_15890 [Myxococcota bacterium]|nr:hypothetical protein [Myxococcota bacterium]